MNSPHSTIITVFLAISFALSSPGIAVEGESGKDAPAKVYVPYEDLKGVFEKADQGVFLPYKDFQKLCRRLGPDTCRPGRGSCGAGRYLLALDFVRQLETQPGLAVVDFRIPSAAITTLELLIPEENLKVDVQPMLAATTSQAKIPLSPITTEQVFRRSGLIGITSSPRRSVHLEDIKNLARVDTGQLPKNLQNRPGVTAYRFITSDYSGTIAIETASSRITVDW